MRVLLVTLSNYLPFALQQVLNPALEYCAIVVDEPDITKKMLENYPPLRDKVYPFYELKECVENNYYDVAIWIFGDIVDDWTIFTEEFKRCDMPKNKFLSLVHVNLPYNFQVEYALRYYKNHSAEFDMFATGISYTELGLLPEIFLPKHKLFNFARASQDLYYDYQVAKYVLEVCGGGYIKYALIGLAPYSFNFDLTKSFELNFQLLQFFIAYDDVHNLWIPKDSYRKLFNENYLNVRIPLGNNKINSVSGLNLNKPVRYMNYKERITSRKLIDGWKNKDFPETKKENSKILDGYLTLCEKNNVRPIMFLPPFTEGYKKYFSRQKLDEFYYLIREAQKKHSSAIFFDGWKLPGFSDEHFHDAAHLNIQGAAKFSTILNNVIEQLEK